MPLADEDHEARADAEGRWLFVHPAAPPEDRLLGPGSCLGVHAVV
jgi:hypothetical protein